MYNAFVPHAHTHSYHCAFKCTCSKLKDNTPNPAISNWAKLSLVSGNFAEFWPSQCDLVRAPGV